MPVFAGCVIKCIALNPSDLGRRVVKEETFFLLTNFYSKEQNFFLLVCSTISPSNLNQMCFVSWSANSANRMYDPYQCVVQDFTLPYLELLTITNALDFHITCMLQWYYFVVHTQTHDRVCEPLYLSVALLCIISKILIHVSAQVIEILISVQRGVIWNKKRHKQHTMPHIAELETIQIMLLVLCNFSTARFAFLFLDELRLKFCGMRSVHRAMVSWRLQLT